jgi:hypothetical protein
MPSFKNYPECQWFTVFVAKDDLYEVPHALTLALEQSNSLFDCLLKSIRRKHMTNMQRGTRNHVSRDNIKPATAVPLELHPQPFPLPLPLSLFEIKSSLPRVSV